MVTFGKVDFWAPQPQPYPFRPDRVRWQIRPKNRLALLLSLVALLKYQNMLQQPIKRTMQCQLLDDEGFTRQRLSNNPLFSLWTRWPTRR